MVYPATDGHPSEYQSGPVSINYVDDNQTPIVKQVSAPGFSRTCDDFVVDRELVAVEQLVDDAAGKDWLNCTHDF